MDMGPPLGQLRVLVALPNTGVPTSPPSLGRDQVLYLTLRPSSGLSDGSRQRPGTQASQSEPSL